MNKLKRIILLFSTLIPLAFIGCGELRNDPNFPSFPRPTSGLFVLDESETGMAARICDFNEFNDEVPMFLKHYVSGLFVENISNAWTITNEDMLEQMEKEWRESPYYTEDKCIIIEFTLMKDLSIICTEEMWGRERGAELVDMFLFKPEGPFFSYPDGKLLPDDGLNEWMTIDELLKKECVYSLLHVKPKEPTPIGDIIIMGVKRTSTSNWGFSQHTSISHFSATNLYEEYYTEGGVPGPQKYMIDTETWTVVENEYYKE